jgi:hypothetical protein
VLTCSGANWRLNYTTCAYVFVPARVADEEVDYVRLEYGVLARRGRQGTMENAFTHSQHLEMLAEAPGGFAGYVTAAAVQDSTSNEFDVGVYTREIVVFTNGERTTMPRRVFFFARPEEAMITCGELDLTLAPQAARSAAAGALAEAVNSHKATETRTNDVLFVARWRGSLE